MNALQKIWSAWKRFGHFMGEVVGRLVLIIFYFTIMLPFGVGQRLFGDRLGIKGQRTPEWLARQTGDLALEDARRMS